MSLDFSVEHVADHANITTAPYTWMGKEQWHPVTEMLIWATIPIGISRITEETVEEFWDRLEMWQHIKGSFLHAEGVDEVWATRADVEAHIGLTTNASPRTREEFLAHCFNESRRGRAQLNPNGLSAMQVIGWKGHPSELPK